MSRAPDRTSRLVLSGDRGPLLRLSFGGAKPDVVSNGQPADRCETLDRWEAWAMQGLLITGPPRSGASAVAAALTRSGAFSGLKEDLVPPGASDVLGTHERIDARDLNARILDVLGGAWDRPNAAPDVAQVTAARTLAKTDYLPIIRSLATEARTRGTVWFLKDPRFSIIPPAVLRSFSGAHVAIVARDPSETARSLARNYEMDVRSALDLWERYLAGAIALGRSIGSSSIVLHHELMTRPLQTVTRLLAETGLPEAAAPFAAGAIRPFLQHERMSPGDPKWCSEGSAAMWSALVAGQLPAPVAPDRGSTPFFIPKGARVAGQSAHRVEMEDRATLERLLSDVAGLAATLEETESLIHRREAELNASREELRATREETALLIADSGRRLVRSAVRLSRWAAPYFRWWRSRAQFRGFRRRVGWLAYGAWVVYRLVIPLRVRLLVPRRFRNASESALQRRDVPVVEVRTAPAPSFMSTLDSPQVQPAEATPTPGTEPAIEIWALPAPVTGYASTLPPFEQRGVPPVFATYAPQFGLTRPIVRTGPRPSDRRGGDDVGAELADLRRAAPMGAQRPVAPVTVRKDSALARSAGIDGFMVYLHHFDGRPMLDGPLRAIADDEFCDRRFFGCWANEDWMQRPSGLDDALSVEDDDSHASLIAAWNDMQPFITSGRYFHVRDRPVFGILRPSLLDEGWWDALEAHSESIGALRPILALVAEPSLSQTVTSQHSIERLLDRGDAFLLELPTRDRPAVLTASGHDERTSVREEELHPDPDLPVIRAARVLPHERAPGVAATWDAAELHRLPDGAPSSSTPPEFGRSLLAALTWASTARDPSPLVLIRGWNEWRTGSALEPDADEGYARLDASRDAVLRASLLRRDAGRVAAGASTSDAAPERRDAVIVHAYYPDLLTEIVEASGAAAELPWFVTTGPSRRQLAQCQRVLDHAGICAQLRPVANRGRDIWPFLQLLPELSLLGFTGFIKVHTKRSPHRIDGDRWRRDLIMDVFRLWDRERAKLAVDPPPAMSIPRRHALSLSSNIGNNAALFDAIQHRAGNHAPVRGDHRFAAGSMFLGGVDAFASLAARLRMWADDFPAERGQIDATMAHALERSWAVLLEAEGHTVRTG